MRLRLGAAAKMKALETYGPVGGFTLTLRSTQPEFFSSSTPNVKALKTELSLHFVGNDSEQPMLVAMDTCGHSLGAEHMHLVDE